jgi:hypothetical protein
MPSMSRRRRLAEIAVVALFTGCSHRLPNGAEWAGKLAVRPGRTLPREGVSQQQVHWNEFYFFFSAALMAPADCLCSGSIRTMKYASICGPTDAHW